MSNQEKYLKWCKREYPQVYVIIWNIDLGVIRMKYRNYKGSHFFSNTSRMDGVNQCAKKRFVCCPAEGYCLDRF